VVKLAVSGAQVEPAADGARLVLRHSARKIAYSRLRVTDATGKELPARIEVLSKSEIRNPKSEMDLAMVVNDADAMYPVRIDPTFSDANWVSLGGVPGANGYIYAAVIDGSGNLYIGGEFFTAAGNILANNIAEWNGSSWSALGSGLSGGYGVAALAASGGTLYAGGNFTTAGTNFSANAAMANLPGSLAIITTNAAFGFTGDVFGFDVSGPSGANVVIQASTDLQTWIPLQTNLLGSRPLHFSDAQSPTNAHRFYRAQLSP
jgi:hypothetical protein